MWGDGRLCRGDLLGHTSDGETSGLTAPCGRGSLPACLSGSTGVEMSLDTARTSACATRRLVIFRGFCYSHSMVAGGLLVRS
jgi:hypothetical protein